MILFFDIETISHPLISKDKYQERYAEKLNFMPEFNQIFCISVGYIAADGTHKISTLSGDEKEMIQEFMGMIKSNTLSGFNIKGFDIPFIVKRAMHHEIAVPNSIKLWGRKPWELDNMLDLCEVYKHTGMPASLDICCQHLGIVTPKNGIDGSQVQAFFDDGRAEEIKRYCEEDVRATMDLYRKLKELNFI